MVFSQVYSGEIAQYKILGISADSRYLIFSEYGINKENKMFSSLFVVNVPQNAFVSNGIVQNEYKITPQIDQDGTHALLHSVSTNRNLFEQYKINMLDSGKLIYVLLNGDDETHTITFTDFDADIKYTAELIQNTQKKKDATLSSFYISTSITEAGKTATFIVGNPDYYRKNIKKYLIRSAYTTQDNNALLFIIEKHVLDDSSSNVDIRYMIETLMWQD